MEGNLKGIAFVGYKKSGKTTLISQVIELFQKKGKKVGVAKFSHHTFNLANTDTGKFLKQKCISIGINEKESFISWPEKKYLPDLLPLLSSHILLVEGGKHLTWLPRIILPQKEEDLQKLDNGLSLAYYSPKPFNSPLKHIAKPEEIVTLIEEKGFVLPGLDCEACGLKGCLEAGKLIVQGKANISVCKALKQDRLEIKVNGHPLSTNPFVCKLIEKTLLAMLSELKGFVPGEVSLKLKTK
jgi:molybdopterin-guanine dinucleotide biosynthesis protein B